MKKHQNNQDLRSLEKNVHNRASGWVSHALQTSAIEHRPRSLNAKTTETVLILLQNRFPFYGKRCMECKNGQKYPTPADIFRIEIEWKRRSAYARGLQLALATRLPFPFPSQTMRIHQYHLPVFPPPMPPTAHIQEPNPFMNKMMEEEITYWVTTKRAPCLLNYDNVIKRPNEQAHCSKEVALKTTPSAEVTHPKNKKRKLKIIEDSGSEIFVEKSLNKYEKAPKSVRSDSSTSNLDFIIKPAVQSKPKTVKLQKKKKKVLAKANKVYTSTPKITKLRRSLRSAQRSNNNNSQLNDSFEILDASAVAEQDKHEIKIELNKNIKLTGNVKTATNGKYEDSSDVSGFTANYIRSTKVSSKPATKAQNKVSRNQAKLKKSTNDHDNIIMCVNKSVNTGNPNAVLNCSTDSSQNIINLVTVQQETTNNVDKSTSLLKFVNIKNNQEFQNPEKKVRRQRNIINYDTSFQSKSSSTSRYPKRKRKVSLVDSEKDCCRVNTPEKTLPKSCATKESKSERKENSVNVLSKTRSGRKIGFNMDPEMSGCSRLNINNSSEQVSSGVTLNVGSRKTRKTNSRTQSLRNRSSKNMEKKDSLSDENKKNVVGESSCVQLRSTRSTRPVKKLKNETGRVLQKDSFKKCFQDSGFTACFSDSDSDNEPLKQRKFFW